MRILIVDDDKEICSMLSLFFDKYGYKVETVYSGEDALTYLKDKHNEFDLVILDLHMHGICGIETCKQIRLFSEIPILVLTSCNEDIQTILALEIGADDYMTKPFKAMTLLARIKAILRRSHKQQPRELVSKFISYSFSNCILDTGTQTLIFDKKIIPITTGIYRILKHFVESPQIVISRADLMDAIQNKTLESFDRSIDIQISRLRKILANCQIQNAIKTIHGSGYMWTIPVIRN